MDYHKVLFEINYGFVKFLFRRNVDSVAVESYQLILSQTNTCKWVYFSVNSQAGTCDFTKNDFLAGNFKEFSKIVSKFT